MDTLRTISLEKLFWGYMAFLGIAFFTTLVAVTIIALSTEAVNALSTAPAPFMDRIYSNKDLTGLQIIDTEQVVCGEGSEGEIEWTNDTGEPIYITSVDIWMGMFMGSKSDFAVWLQRHGRESTLLRSNWDHYADPVSPDHTISKDYSPHHITLLPNEVLTLHYSCSNLDYSNAVGHATVMIWYYQ